MKTLLKGDTEMKLGRSKGLRDNQRPTKKIMGKEKEGTSPKETALPTEGDHGRKEELS